MISVVHASNTLNKTYNIDGSKTSGANLSNFHIKTFDCDTPHDLQTILEQLEHNEIIISGTAKGSTHNVPVKMITAKRENFDQGVWYPFDRDYQVVDQPTIELLQQLDPQFKYISYLRKSSASNIFLNDVLQAPYREKVWVKFAPNTTHEQVQDYVIKLMKKAYLLGYARKELSPNEDSPALVQAAVFDASCFRPEALHYEGVPVIHNSDIKHNTYYEAHTGEQDCIDTTKLHFSAMEDTRYIRKYTQLKKELEPAYKARLAQFKRLRPKQDWNSLEQGFISDDVELHTTDGDIITVNEVLEKLITNQPITSYLELEYTDPLDPSYHDSTQKAKLYLNKDNTLILHSFAHGSHHYRAAANISQVPEILEKLQHNIHKPSSEEKRKILAELNRILPFFYIPSLNDADFVADSMKKVASKAIIKKIFLDGAYNPYKTIPLEEHPLREYVFLKAGGGQVITLDPEEGMVHMSLEGAKAFLENKHENFTGRELLDMWLQHPDRKDIMTFGLYEQDEPNKLSMWADFSTYELGKTVTEHDIQPFIYHMKLATGDDPQALIYMTNWIADMVQFPLREGSRPAIVLQSEEQGTGKGTFFTLLASFFQPYNTFESAKLDSLVGRFNKHLMSTVLFGLDEVVAGGEFKPGQITDLLKNITTEDRLALEIKNVDVKQVPNKIHLIVMTNKDFIYLDSQNRRFTIFPFSAKHKQDIPYNKEIRDWWYNRGGKELTFTYFRQYKVDKELAQTNYKNDATVASSIKNLYGVRGRDKWLFYFLADLLEEENKFTSESLHQSYISAYSAFHGSDVGALDKREITSFLKSTFGDTPALGYKSNNYIVRRSVMREKFAFRFLSGIQFKWEDYSEVSSDELNLKQEVAL